MDSNPNSPPQVFCPNCRGGNPPDATNCIWCGQLMPHAQPTMSVAQPPRPQAQPAPSPGMQAGQPAMPQPGLAQVNVRPRQRPWWLWALIPVGVLLALCTCITVAALVIPSPDRDLARISSEVSRTATALAGQSSTREEATPTRIAARIRATNTPLVPRRPTVTPTRVLIQALVKAATLNVHEAPGASDTLPLAEVNAGDSLTVLGRAASQPWIKVRLADGSEGWIAADPEQVALEAELDALPVAYFRPRSSIVQATDRFNGSGQLEIQNNSTIDSLVIVTQDNDPLVAAYVRASETYKLDKIPDGEYTVFVVSGDDWDGRTFSRNMRGKRFEDTFPYTTKTEGSSIEYTVWTITLAATAGGTASTEQVDPEDIPLISPDTEP